MLTRIIFRIKQLWFSVFATYTKVDEVFVRQYLNIQERSLFNQLPNFEKKHSIMVAKKMQRALHHHPELDERKIVRLGLLHDIGKVMERNSVLTKSILVIVRFIFPWLYDRLAEAGKRVPLLRRFYIHKHHGAVGAEMLSRIGESSEILAIIAKHDPRNNPFGYEDPIEMKILQEADGNYWGI